MERSEKGVKMFDRNSTHDELVDRGEQEVLYVAAPRKANEVNHACHGVQGGRLHDHHGDRGVYLPVFGTDGPRECASHHYQSEGDGETQEYVEAD